MNEGEPSREIALEVARITSENARLLERLGESERRFRLISRGVLRVQEAERGRISRELHDSVGQSLTALKIELELLERAEAGGPLAARLAELRGLAEACLQEVRQLSRLLRPPMLDDLGLVPTLRWLARTLQQQTGLTVALSVEGIEERTEPELETLVFRVVQEALTNVVKHSGSDTARVGVAGTARSLRLTVEDQGAGFDTAATLGAAEQARGFGLGGMRDRVQLLGGRFEVRSAPGRGTIVDVEVPLGRDRGGS